MRYLAIDHGSRRIGLAICDARETIASPLCVLDGRRDVLAEIAGIVEAEGVEGIVLGLPLNMDGSEGPQAAKAKAFGEQLARRIGLPIYMQDERLSSFGAAEKLESAGLSRAHRRDRLDAVAAAEILQAFLDERGADECRQ
ncbi:Holliday junction resolvase RuvX [Anaerobaca lacustris]|uniref:Putative pre-16S rRNA nuclease n=1 Tax=Anaerobaca lacustris TaxID=3044600 RepID=A0AAW6TTX9_9BACT|nr:Holliday junction resolvase RuvX [Sedimentisphaerales bacterium M17dextr]